MTTTIVIDTSSASGLLAMVRGQEVLQEFRFTTGRASDPAEFQSALAKLLADQEKCSLIVVGLGPGNHSSVRVGIASAIGLSIGLNVPVCGVPSPLGYDSRRTEFIAIGKAGRDELWAFRSGGASSNPNQSVEIIKSTQVVGSSKKDRVTVDGTLGDIAEVVTLRASRLAQAAVSAESSRILEPIYLRPANITLAKTLPQVHWQGMQDQR